MPISNARNRLDLESNEAAFKTVANVAPLEVYLAGNIVDGNGDTIPSRVVCRIRGTKKFYFLFPPGTEESLRSAAPWLQKELEKRIDGESVEATPKDMDRAVPTGNPLG